MPSSTNPNPGICRGSLFLAAAICLADRSIDSAVISIQDQRDGHLSALEATSFILWGTLRPHWKAEIFHKNEAHTQAIFTRIQTTLAT